MMCPKWYQFVHIISFQNHHVGGLGLRLVYSVTAQDHRCPATDLTVTTLFIFCLIEKSKSLLFHKSCLCSLQCSFHCEMKCQILPHVTKMLLRTPDLCSLQQPLFVQGYWKMRNAGTVQQRNKNSKNAYVYIVLATPLCLGQPYIQRLDTMFWATDFAGEDSLAN